MLDGNRSLVSRSIFRPQASAVQLIFPCIGHGRTSLAKWWEFGSLFRCSSPLASSTPWQTCSSCQQDCFQASSFANVCKMGKITSQVKCLVSLAVLQRMLFLYVFVRCTTELGRYFGEELDPCDHWQCHRRSLCSLSFNQRHSDVEMRPHLL